MREKIAQFNSVIKQLPPELQEAVLANARSKIVFQTTANDAQAMSREFGSSVDDNPNATWKPAASGNFGAGRRSGISQITFHHIVGDAAGAIARFQTSGVEGRVSRSRRPSPSVTGQAHSST